MQYTSIQMASNLLSGGNYSNYKTENKFKLDHVKCYLTFEDASIQFISREHSQCLRTPWRICLVELTLEKAIFGLSVNQPVMDFSVTLGFGCNSQDTKGKGHCKTSSFSSCYFTFFLNSSLETQETFSTAWNIHLSPNDPFNGTKIWRW